jgi:hypothetical protein
MPDGFTSVGLHDPDAVSSLLQDLTFAGPAGDSSNPSGPYPENYSPWSEPEWYSDWVDARDAAIVTSPGPPAGTYAHRGRAGYVHSADGTYRAQTHAPAYGSLNGPEVFRVIQLYLPTADWPTSPNLAHALFYEEYGGGYTAPGAPIIIGFNGGNVTQLGFAASRKTAPNWETILTPVPRDTWIQIIMGVIYGASGSVRIWIRTGGGAFTQKTLFGSLQPTLDTRNPTANDMPHPIIGPYYSYSGGVTGARRTAYVGGSRVYGNYTDAETWALSGGGGSSALPALPTGLAVTGATSTTVTVGWNASSDFRSGDSYQVYIFDASDNFIAPWRDVPAGTTTYTFTGLNPLTQYGFRIGAGQAGSYTGWTTPSVVGSTTGTGTAPNALTGHTLVSTDTGFTLDTTDPTGITLAATTPYRIYRSATRGGVPTLVGAYSTLPASFDPGDGTWYFYATVTNSSALESPAPPTAEWVKGISAPDPIIFQGGPYTGTPTTFEGSTLGTGWGLGSGSVTYITSGTVKARLAPGTQITSTGTLDPFLGREVVVDISDLNITSASGDFHLRVYPASFTSNLEFYLDPTGTDVGTWNLGQGGGGSYAFLAYNPATHKYIRIRRLADGGVEWHWSADAQTWNLAHSLSAPTGSHNWNAPIVTVQFNSGSGYADIEAINVIPQSSAPSVVAVTGTEENASGTNATVTFGVQAGGSALTQIQYRIDGGSWTNTASTATRSVTVSNPAPGAHTVDLRATNAIGTSAEQTWSFTTASSSTLNTSPYWGVLA